MLRGGTWTLAGKVANAGALLLLNAVLARALLPADFASFLLAFSAAMLLGIFCSLGLDGAAVRFIAEARTVGDQSKVYGTTQRILLLLAASMVVTGAGVALLAVPVFMHSSSGEGDRFTLSLLLGGWAATNGARLILAGLLRGFHALVAGALFEGVLANALSAVIIAGLYLAGVTLDLAIVLCVTVGCGALSAALALGRVLGLAGVRPAVMRASSRALLAVSLPMVVTAFVGQLSVQLPLWAVAGLGTGQDAAVFGLGMQLSVLANLPFIAITLAGSPTTVQLNAAREFTALQAFLRRASILAAIPAAAVVIMTLLFGRSLMTVAFGSAYGASALVAVTLCMGRLVQSLTGLNEMLLAMTGGERVLSVVLVAIACLTAPACVVAFHAGGLLGVATASSLLMALQGIMLARASRRRLGFRPGLA